MPPISKLSRSRLVPAALVMVLGAALLAPLAPARAYITALPASLAPDTLSETVPTAFAPFALQSDDYFVEWQGPHPAGLEARLLPGTLQWVRVADVLTLPRARLRVEVTGAAFTGRVSNAGFSQALAPSAGPPARASAEVPVALISGEQNAIDIVLTDARGTETHARAVLRFRPRASLGAERVFTDPSCSRFGLRATGSAQSARARGWAVIGCRVAEVEGAEHRTSSLEAWVYWDGVGQEILVGGARTPASSVSVWPLRLRAEPGKIQLAATFAAGGSPADEMTLAYATPDYFHRGSLGVGIGPYWDRLDGNNETMSTAAPMLTIYGSYFIKEDVRLVSFDATTFDRHLTTDFGVYVSTESLKVVDRRLVVNLLLGAHAIGFMSAGTYQLKLGAPQGAEILILEPFTQGKNVSAGFFLYPLISGVSYYNLWLRYGGARFFGEFNYISWDEPLTGATGDVGIHSQSVGVSVGFPLARFL